ncbi:MAG TPA: ABC transporter permease [Candidatus Mediterraneibacter stercoravium]|uniref:ABC transporter permease n=1 Tax=Candidatus Mediterraneibacter stercoravium TaxID=2838685 RepID=A0A9D2K1Z4_9FIRM|nr:ABC transporter permease [Candidatus Mediterraneibacter stercoravium]
MRKVKNKKVIRKLSARILSAKRSKNLIGLAAILLTTILFTTVFSVCGNLLRSQTESTFRQVGGNAQAGFKNFTMAEYDQLKEDSGIRDVSYNIFVGNAVNPQLNKLQTEVRYYEPLNARQSFAYPTTGKLPEEQDEIAMSTLILDALDIPHELGQKVTLDLNIHNEIRTDTFTLCGFWEGDPVMMAQEAAVSKTYADLTAPLETTPYYETDGTDYSGYMNISFNFSSSFNIEGQMEELIRRGGFDGTLISPSVNWAYSFSSIDWTTVSVLTILILLIMLSGYLIIYNIFYLNIFSDIRFYGLLKTVGTTGRQLRKIVRRQAWALCLFGVPAGLAAGWVIGRLLTPVITDMLTSTDVYYSANPLIFLGSALFTVLTVYISCIKPCRIAAKVSPVEAVRFTEKSIRKKSRKTKKTTPLSMARANLGRNKRKLVLVVLSLSLSLVLLNSVYTIVTGFDMDKYLADKLLTDFEVSSASIYNFNSPEIDYAGVTRNFQEELSAQEGVTDIGNIYLSGTVHNYSDAEWETVEQIMDAPENSEYFSDPIMEEAFDYVRTSHRTNVDIYGVNETAAKYIKPDEGTFDWEKFKSGNYILANSFSMDDETSMPFLKPGDEVTVRFSDTVSKKYTVLAVAQMPTALSSQRYGLMNEEFILPDTEFLTQFGDRQPMKTVFNVSDDRQTAVAAWLEDYCEKVNPDMDYRTKADYQQEFSSLKQTYAVTGGILSIILALIGLLNFINVTATSILSRRQELAMMESVGMTGAQQRRMLLGEGLCYALLSILISCTAGVGAGYALVLAFAGQMDVFTWRFTLLPVAICTPFLIAISLAVPSVCYAYARKQSVVERLRTTE